MTDPNSKLKDQPFFEAHNVPLARLAFSDAEVAAVVDVVRSGYLCQGPKVAQFEAVFAEKFQIGHAVAVSSGSAALLVALQALGVGGGDEVIVPDMTFISSATAAMYLGARPVLCDISLTDFNIDPVRVEYAINEKTKVLLPVHYAGQSADMEALGELARKYDLLLLEDAAEAHLARFKGKAYCGTIGDVGIFSFTPTKPMTTGEGGVVVTDDDDIAERCRRIRNFGDEEKFAWNSLGFNFRMTEMAAAIGLCQLDKLESFIRGRREKARYYDETLAGEEMIMTPVVRGPEDSNYQLYTILLDIDKMDVTRDDIIAELAQLGVAARLYYPALHKMGVFSHFGPFDDDEFKNAMAFEKKAISLPLFNDLTRSEQDHVVESLINLIQSHLK